MPNSLSYKLLIQLKLMLPGSFICIDKIYPLIKGIFLATLRLVVQAQCDLTKQTFIHNSKIHTPIIKTHKEKMKG